jgi:hypothetical protein
MPKKIKDPKQMTSDEVMAHVFHPDALKHLKAHVAELNTAKRKPSKKSAK